MCVNTHFFPSLNLECVQQIIVKIFLFLSYKVKPTGAVLDDFYYFLKNLFHISRTFHHT